MNPEQSLIQLRANTRQILSCQSDFLLMKQSVDHMYQLFSTITGIDISGSQEEILLPSGKAISSSAAAHCLLELKRTAVFLRGIYQAILDKKAEKPEWPVKILYAGTGPYGTLVIPLFSVLSPADVQADLLDINPCSLDSLRKLIKAFGFDEFVGNIYTEDASTFKIGYDYDIVISETMQSCLKNEPQVAVMQNLIPQMGSCSIFIPEEISIDAALTNPKMEHDRFFYYEGEKLPFARIPLGNIFVVNKENLINKYFKKTLFIPGNIGVFTELKLFTTIRVYADEVLGENDSSLNLPVRFIDLKAHPASVAEFWYEQGTKPQIRCKYYTPDRFLKPVRSETQLLI
ncbi:MAG: hypothetical protein RBS73_08905 [Prolixibacteraceae bacterium]|jgi:predicted RNA methylase|nr:hypothetical protein [Prolixibacteraceae bacterium]